MGMQAKRIQLTDATLAAGGQSNVILTVPDEPREAVNKFSENPFACMYCKRCENRRHLTVCPFFRSREHQKS